MLCVVFGNCENKGVETTKYECSQESMPKYDYRATIKGEMTPQIDSVLRIEKRRDVFKPCRKHIYKARFFSKANKLISDELISIMATGKRWEYQPEKQDEIEIVYNFDKDRVDTINSFQLNKNRITDFWRSNEITGIIENVENIWMHPIRSNQYNFTQVAPFPQIEFPLKVGKKWTDKNISMKEGFGDWSNMRVKSEFEVLSKESIEIQYGIIENCWKINSISNFDLGRSSLTYWFHEKLGFVKLNYINYGNQKLNIELTKIEEKSR
jgi:hypothetical protein